MKTKTTRSVEDGIPTRGVGTSDHLGLPFTIRAKRPITADEAAQYPRLPDDWQTRATIL